MIAKRPIGPSAPIRGNSSLPLQGSVAKPDIVRRRRRGSLAPARPALIAIALGLLLLAPQPGAAQDAEPWLIFDPLHGDITLRYENVDTKTHSPSGPGRNQYYFNYEEINLLQRLTIYDPRFIDINLGLGLQWGQGHHDREGETNRITKYNLAASILSEKPVSMDAYAARYQAEYLQSPTTLTLENRRERSVGLLLKEDTGSPIPISLRYTTAERAYDNRGNVGSLGAPLTQILAFQEASRTTEIASNKTWQHFSLNWRAKRRTVETRQDAYGVHSDTQYEQSNFFLGTSGQAGDDNRFRWRLQLIRDAQTRFPDYTQSNADGGANFRLYEDWASSLEAVLALRGSRLEQESPAAPTGHETIDNRRVEAGLNHRLFKSLFTELKSSKEETNYPDHVILERASSAQVRYAKSIPRGTINAGVGVSTRLRHSEGSELLLAIDESHALTTSVPVKLNSPNIALASIVVTDQFKTITYVEGVDYIVSQSGRDTFIEKIGVAIQDGQTVLVSYQFTEPSVDIKGRTTNYSYSVHWWFVEPYTQVANTREETSDTSPNASLALNPGRSEVYGIKLEQKLWDILTPTYTAENEKNRYLLDPFNRQTRNARVQLEIAVGVGAAAYREQVQIDHLITPYDSAVTRQGVDAFYARGRLRVDLRAAQDRSLASGTAHTVNSQEARLTTWYGQWVLESTLRLAHDTFSNPGISASSFSSDFTAFTLGVKRVF